MYVCMACLGLHMCGCMYMRGLGLRSRIILHCSSTLFVEAGSLRQTHSQLALENFPSPPFLPSEDGITGGCHAHPPSKYMGFLGPIHIHGILTLVLAFI